ncbi:MAG TPA: phosphatase PAP2 family protein [bacterium]|jgi:undecaprenyl-diphosphatase
MKGRVLVITLLVAALVALGSMATTAPVLAIDRAVLLFVQRHLRVTWLDAIFLHLTLLGDAALILTLLLWAALVVRRPFVGDALVTLALTAVTVALFKHLFAHPRPPALVEGLRVLGPYLRNFSFPSGHTTTAVAVAWVLAKRFPAVAVPLLALAGLVAFSRVYNGVHFPIDMVAGCLLGSAIGLAVDAARPVLDRLWSRLRLHRSQPRGHILHALLLFLIGLLLTWQAFKTKMVPDSWRWPLLMIGVASCLTAYQRSRPLLFRRPH